MSNSSTTSPSMKSTSTRTSNTRFICNIGSSRISGIRIKQAKMINKATSRNITNDALNSSCSKSSLTSPSSSSSAPTFQFSLSSSDNNSMNSHKSSPSKVRSIKRTGLPRSSPPIMKNEEMSPSYKSKTNGVRKKRRIQLINHNEKLLLASAPSSSIDVGENNNTNDDVDDVSSHCSGDLTITPTKSSIHDSLKSNSVSSKGTSKTNSSLKKKRRYGRQSLASESPDIDNDNRRSSSLSSNCTIGSSCSASSKSLSPDKTVLGAGADVLAVQDAGSFRLEYEHICYLCSTIMSASINPNDRIEHCKATCHALAEISNRMSLTKQRKSVIQSSKDTASSVVKALLSVFETVPFISNKSASQQSHNNSMSRNTKSSRRKMFTEKNHNYNEKAMLSLSFLLYFISIDISQSQSLKKLIMKNYLKALLGMVRICSFEPWLRPYLSESPSSSSSSIAQSPHKSCIASTEIEQESLSFDHQTPTKEGNNAVCSSTDPTSVGRRSRKRKQQQKQVFQSTTSILQTIKDDEPLDLTSSRLESTPNTQTPENNGWKSPSTSSSISTLSFVNSTDTIKIKTSPSTPNSSSSSNNPSLSPVLEQEEDTILLQSMQQIFSQQHEKSTLEHIFFADNCCGVDCPYQDFKHPVSSAPATNNHQYALKLEMASGTLALVALKRILSPNSAQDDSNASDNSNNNGNIDENDADNNNPVLFMNNALIESNSLPLLANIMIDTISTILVLLATSSKKSPSIIQDENFFDHSCFHLLHFRLNTIQSILDETCCLVQPNAQSILSSAQIGLVSSLLRLISTSFVMLTQLNADDNNSHCSNTVLLSDLIVSSLQTLVSVTHENSLAVHQFINFDEEINYKYYPMIGGKGGGGAKLIFELIYYCSSHFAMTTEKASKNNETVKQTYDTIVYCLNILTNVMEVLISSSSAAAIMSFQKDILEFNVRQSSDDNCYHKHRSGILWLSSWLVSLTTTYQNAILKSSFGKTEDSSLPGTIVHEGKQLQQCKENDTSTTLVQHSSNEERDLTKEEEESLVLAGNGFIFLVWFMKQPQNSDKISLCDSNRTSLDLMEHKQKNNNELAITRQQIFSLMPYSKGKLYISNTLKAFSNYYHHSIGELSFAVVAPVRKLIIELERF